VCKWLVLLLIACGGQGSSDAGVKNAVDTLPTVNIYCKEWRDGTYFDVGKREWVEFEWCAKW
jgi:hypothetical protein